jgi:CspA family cold shock protein
MNEGRVKVFDILKGYGFITRPKGKDLFFHWSDIESKFQGAAVAAGMIVQYEIDDKKQNRAINVKIMT